MEKNVGCGCDSYCPLRPDIQNCPNCRNWNRETHRCQEEARLLKIDEVPDLSGNLPCKTSS